jgi:hypothetical protein
MFWRKFLEYDLSNVPILEKHGGLPINIKTQIISALPLL